MPNGYGVCPSCGRSTTGYPEEAWQSPPTWPGAAWHWGPGMGPPMPMGPGRYGAGYGAGPGYGPPYAPAYYGGLPTDSEIEEMIYDSMDADPLIPFDASIDVSVEAGTVYLRGEVPSKRIKHAAGDDAWWIPGVVDVHNEMKVTARRRGKAEGGAE